MSIATFNEWVIKACQKYLGFPSNPALDAFGRTRVSNPVTIFEAQAEYGTLEGLLFDHATDGVNGSLTHLPDESCVLMSTGGNGFAIRQTIQYFRYQPGKSQQIPATVVFGASTVGATKRVGYYDDDNGVFLEDNSSVISVVLRSSVTGSAVDDPILQEDWNIDKLDGRGPSSITLDVSKAQIVAPDLQWLGVGRVRIGLEIDGELIYIHEYKNANIADTTYMTTANLPVRWEIEGTVAATMKAICCAVISEGGVDDVVGFPFATDTLTTLTNVPSTGICVLAVRPKATFKGKGNHVRIDLDDVEAICRDTDILVRIVWNPTIAGAPSWTSVDTDSAMERSINVGAASNLSNGKVIESFFVTTSGAGVNQRGTGRQGINSKLPITVRLDGTQIPIAVVAYAIPSASATANVGAHISWEEDY